ncbi:hypothetical protein [Chryseosolibacter indicus]|uniref:DUF4469 domain-containing protein n=1 Tax=Chryseosolibacter indicus TaxID=2782351 RepID=A0ABS5VP78_9BACT|nr:hypothetical protein [Chryseosolibacter indicus]MBT1702589.1 hypothetical protein [Chryseosolibacter indicus]
MAIIHTNPIIKGVRGSLGGVMFRRVGKTTILSAKPSAPKKQSEQQRNNRLKFKEASAFAKHILKDPQKKIYYQHKAKKLRYPNAYTAALTDYMRKIEVRKVERLQCKDKKDIVKVNVAKQDFTVRAVKVAICNQEGLAVFSAVAEKRDNTTFIFQIPHSYLHHCYKLKVIAEDNTTNTFVHELFL